MIKFSKKEMKKASNQLRKGIKENKGYLSSIIMTDMSGKKHFVDCASDSHTAWNYVCIGYSKKTSPDSTYPKRPF